MAFAIGAPVPWSVPPDWSRPVRESLAWLTRVPPASDPGKAKLREVPRRSLSFEVLCAGNERRIMDLAQFDHGAREWELPLWHDGQVLAEVADATDFIACQTTGREFIEGGRALIWQAVDQWEIVTIAAVDPSGLSLNGTTAQAWPRGPRIYPLRRSRLSRPSVQTGRNDRVARLRVEFDLVEVSPYPQNPPIGTYRDLPVLEWRRDEREDPTADIGRVVEMIDVQTGPVLMVDIYGRPVPTQDHRWLLHGRPQQVAWRSLLYWLAGRYQTLWIPTYMADLEQAAPIGSSSTALAVEATAYPVFGRQQPGRRDIRIELNDGTVFYRRITGTQPAPAGQELLTLDSALGRAVTPGQVRLISFMFPAQQAADTVSLDHITDADGTARAHTRWEAVAYDG